MEWLFSTLFQFDSLKSSRQSSKRAFISKAQDSRFEILKMYGCHHSLYVQISMHFRTFSLKIITILFILNVEFKCNTELMTIFN